MTMDRDALFKNLERITGDVNEKYREEKENKEKLLQGQSVRWCSMEKEQTQKVSKVQKSQNKDANNLRGRKKVSGCFDLTTLFED